MKIKVSSITVGILILILMVASAALAAQRGNVELVTKEQLLKMMNENDPELIILDVRKGTDWRASQFMIKGAIRLDLNKISTIKYPKDKKLVFY
ncbi:MAG TPA: hypothetical protein ENI12_00890 [Nitrospirae bacterium]|nr:hypothetical protein [Nitrospirota bacterium]